MKLTQIYSLALLVTALTSCASVGRTGLAPATGPHGMTPTAGFSSEESDSSYYSRESSYYSITNDSLGPVDQGIEVYWQHLELDEIETESVFSDGSRVDVDLEDVDRRRVGLRYVAGTPWVSAHLGVFLEEFLGDRYDNLGLSGGLRAEPVLGSANGIDILANLRGQIAFVRGDVDFPTRDPGTGGVVSLRKEDFDYLDADVEAGFAFDLGGIRPGAGFFLTHLDGEIDVDDEDVDIDGTNAGVYLRLGFFDAACPFFGEASAHFGDVQGVTVSAGLKF